MGKYELLTIAYFYETDHQLLQVVIAPLVWAIDLYQKQVSSFQGIFKLQEKKSTYLFLYWFEKMCFSSRKQM